MTNPVKILLGNLKTILSFGSSNANKNVVTDANGDLKVEDKNNHAHGQIDKDGKVSTTTSSVGNVVVTDSNNIIKTINKLPAANVTHQDITGKLDKSQTSYKGKNVVVHSISGEITFEDKNNHTHTVSNITDFPPIIEKIPFFWVDDFLTYASNSYNIFYDPNNDVQYLMDFINSNDNDSGFTSDDIETDRLYRIRYGSSYNHNIYVAFYYDKISEEYNAYYVTTTERYATQYELSLKATSSDISSAISTHDGSNSAHYDIRQAIPTKTTDLTNDSGFLTNSDAQSTFATSGHNHDGTYLKTSNVFYGTCSTGAATQNKVVSVSNWSWTTGNILFVEFSNNNTYNGTARISINNTVKDIVTIGTSKTSQFHWKGGELVCFVYNGTNMLMLEQGIANTNYYGLTRFSDIVNLIYPVGSIYMSVNSTSPTTLFGGIWVQLTDTFLYATSGTADTGTTAPSGQGEASHTLSQNEMPVHAHKPHQWSVIVSNNANTGNYSNPSGKFFKIFKDDANQNRWTGDSGGGQAHNNMPPYMKVYMWKRTA